MRKLSWRKTSIFTDINQVARHFWIAPIASERSRRVAQWIATIPALPAEVFSITEPNWETKVQQQLDVALEKAKESKLPLMIEDKWTLKMKVFRQAGFKLVYPEATTSYVEFLEQEGWSRNAIAETRRKVYSTTWLVENPVVWLKEAGK